MRCDECQEQIVPDALFGWSHDDELLDLDHDARPDPDDPDED